MKEKYKLVPAGRYLLIKSISAEQIEEESKEEKLVLLPVDAKKQTGVFVAVELLAVGNLCTNYHMAAKSSVERRLVLVQSNLIEKIHVLDQEYEVIQEQYVIGELERAHSTSTPE